MIFKRVCQNQYASIYICFYVIAIFLMENNFLLDNLPATITVIHKDINPEMICHIMESSAYLLHF